MSWPIWRSYNEDEQTHFVVRERDGMVQLSRGLVTYGWTSMKAMLGDPLAIPSYGRVWIHVE